MEEQEEDEQPPVSLVLSPPTQSPGAAPSADPDLPQDQLSNRDEIAELPLQTSEPIPAMDTSSQESSSSTEMPPGLSTSGSQPSDPISNQQSSQLESRSSSSSSIMPPLRFPPPRTATSTTTMPPPPPPTHFRPVPIAHRNTRLPMVSTPPMPSLQSWSAHQSPAGSVNSSPSASPVLQSRSRERGASSPRRGHGSPTLGFSPFYEAPEPISLNGQLHWERPESDWSSLFRNFAPDQREPPQTSSNSRSQSPLLPPLSHGHGGESHNQRHHPDGPAISLSRRQHPGVGGAALGSTSGNGNGTRGRGILGVGGRSLVGGARASHLPSQSPVGGPSDVPEEESPSPLFGSVMNPQAHAHSPAFSLRNVPSHSVPPFSLSDSFSPLTNANETTPIGVQDAGMHQPPTALEEGDVSHAVENIERLRRALDRVRDTRDQNGLRSAMAANRQRREAAENRRRQEQATTAASSDDEGTRSPVPAVPPAPTPLETPLQANQPNPAVTAALSLLLTQILSNVGNNTNNNNTGNGNQQQGAGVGPNEAQQRAIVQAVMAQVVRGLEQQGMNGAAQAPVAGGLGIGGTGGALPLPRGQLPLTGEVQIHLVRNADGPLGVFVVVVQHNEQDSSMKPAAGG